MSSPSAPLYDRDYVLLNGSNFLYSLYSVIFIFLPAYLYRLGIREGAIGVLMGTGALVSVALKLPLGMVVGRGARRAFLSLGAFLAAASTVPWLFVSGPGPHLFFIRVAQGASFSIFSAASYAYLAASAPPERRAEAFGIFGLSFFLPVSVGGWIGEWVIGRAGFHGLFAAGVGVAFLSALFPLAMREPPAREHPSLASLKVFLSRPFFLPNTAGYLFGVAYGAIFTFLPVYLVVRGSGSIGAFVFVYALSVIGTRMLGRRMLDRLPREWVSLSALVLMGAGNLLIPAVPGEVGIVLVGAAAGAGHGLLFPALSALVLDRVAGGSGAMAMAMFTAAFDMGLVTGAAAFGFVAERFGYEVMFVSAAAVVGAGTAAFFGLDPAFRKAGRPERAS
ncbi:MAG: putative transport protein, belonging to the Major Facilitator Superfamily, of which narK is a er [Deltaproteobacteria bacterium]|nr:putative transport protein, belonging to the Major Facilitator Superfamily, of which narK is a er [Deltaproteobacteria bacterium]